MPKNANDEYGGRYSVQAALANSINTITVQVLMENGLSNTVETIQNLGFTSPIPQNPSIALGTAEVSLLELTSAYTSFLNNGKPVRPRDRKSTRLNSSHVAISYAVFCLKKKK